MSDVKMSYLLSFPRIDPHLHKIGASDFPPDRAAYYRRVMGTEVRLDIVMCHEMWERIVLQKFRHMRAVDNGWSISVAGYSEFLYDEDGDVRAFLDSVRHISFDECQSISRQVWSSALELP